jgi:hypothetical protein
MGDAVVGAAWTIFRTIYTQLVDMKKCKKLAAQLKQRLQVLEEPMKQLRQSNVKERSGLDRLIGNLNQLQAVIIKISKRSRLARFFTSSGDNKDLATFNGHITA